MYHEHRAVGISLMNNPELNSCASAEGCEEASCLFALSLDCFIEEAKSSHQIKN